MNEMIIILAFDKSSRLYYGVKFLNFYSPIRSKNVVEPFAIYINDLLKFDILKNQIFAKKLVNVHFRFLPS